MMIMPATTTTTTKIFAFKRKQFADLVVFDDELTPKQGVNIEKALGDKLRVCD